METFFLTLYYYKVLLIEIDNLELHKDIITEMIVSCKLLAILIVFGTTIDLSYPDLRVILNELDYQLTRNNILKVQDIVCKCMDWDLDPMTIYSYTPYINKKYLDYYLFIGFIISLDTTIICAEFEKAIICEKISKLLYNINEDYDIESPKFNKIINSNIQYLNMDNIIDNIYKINKTFMNNVGLIKELHEKDYFHMIVKMFCEYNEWNNIFDDLKKNILNINKDIVNDIVLLFNKE